jgi:hypothetical protein
VGVVKFSELPEEWKALFVARYPKGRACRSCVKPRTLGECSFSRNGRERFVLDRFCPSCKADYWRKQGDLKRSRKASGNRASEKTGLLERNSLPILEVGRKYEVGGECTGRVVALQGPHYVLRTGCGTRCYTTAQLVGLEIREA